jgi:hypothetical protein
MQRSKLFLAGVFLVSLTMSLVAEADDGRARTFREHYETAAWPESPASAISIVQEGRGNAASIVQTGGANAAGIRQFGRGNVGAIIQSGSGNTACLVQTGRNLNGAIQQAGDNQSSGLLQTRWGSSEIPAEVCATATTRQEVMALVFERPGPSPRTRVRGRGGREP